MGRDAKKGQQAINDIGDILEDRGFDGEEQLKIISWLVAIWIIYKGGPCPVCALYNMLTEIEIAYHIRTGQEFPEEHLVEEMSHRVTQ